MIWPRRHTRGEIGMGHKVQDPRQGRMHGKREIGRRGAKRGILEGEGREPFLSHGIVVYNSQLDYPSYIYTYAKIPIAISFHDCARIQLIVAADPTDVRLLNSALNAS